MRKNRRVIVTAAALIVMLACSGLAQAAGALAVGHCGVDGYSYNHATSQAAEETALQQCGPGCEVVLTIQNACAAFATDANKNCGAQGWGKGADRGEAEERAVRECVNQSGERCEVKRWVCDGGG